MCVSTNCSVNYISSFITIRNDIADVSPRKPRSGLFEQVEHAVGNADREHVIPVYLSDGRLKLVH